MPPPSPSSPASFNISILLDFCNILPLNFCHHYWNMHSVGYLIINNSTQNLLQIECRRHFTSYLIHVPIKIYFICFLYFNVLFFSFALYSIVESFFGFTFFILKMSHFKFHPICSRFQKLHHIRTKSISFSISLSLIWMYRFAHLLFCSLSKETKNIHSYFSTHNTFLLCTSENSWLFYMYGDCTYITIFFLQLLLPLTGATY